ncbi:hypothetical protein DPMN_033076 [Dreissena polymorpha]|uniref:Uncharacterized protein n=1 Tax=Dreissena polymorpha TaxID=45954 RepID=A0A9D4M303_DREPO|nr:hypothetical protein DPMN_033076 [Dreissena polymorpha]
MMIVLAVTRISKKQGQGHQSVASIGGVPNLFGVCVYAFMSSLAAVAHYPN